MNQVKSRVSISLSILFLSALVGHELFWFVLDRPESLLTRVREETKVAAALEQGLGFYTPAAIADLRVDDYLLFRLVARQRGLPLDSDPAERYAGDPFRRALDPSRPVQDLVFYRRALPLSGFTGDGPVYLIDPPYDAFLRDPWDDILYKALYCDFSGYDAGDFALLTSRRDGSGGYADTHVLLGLLFLRDNGCYDLPERKAATAQIVRDIARAAQDDLFWSDLYAERIVFLYWAGSGHLVERDWIRLVREHLTDDPGWRTGNETTSNAHTTGLALLSLIYFEDGRATQLFYRNLR